MLLEGVERDVEGLQEVALGRRGVGAQRNIHTRPGVVVENQLLVVGKGLPI